MDEVQDLRIVDDVETLKALSDPLRIGLLRLMTDSGPEPRAWTAKELAKELGEPQTKLYRHLKHLEEAGLIAVAETRLVSGIVEQRYVAAQRRLQLGRGLLSGADEGELQGEVEAVALDAAVNLVGSAAESFLHGFEGALRSGRVDIDAADDERRPVVMFSDIRIPPARVAEFQRRFRKLVADVDAEPSVAEGVPLHLMVALYSPDE
ncbi:winged helix-turn-helix domain-containing protein [Streptacidiphilus fuscans]|uniref:Helix-turn-helix transcriptional regulator n=1 Tax=Streptacidiphilus fuscans TaxID=2789292 RepID=A0A931FHC7_9ACTN|nr:helix-turn-helix domain-containing protein [Streptacidiphilus fuscans]MBF9070519.1 helix-turn-helix transcriptional regulator [Streptacidiphilus fuscans]